MYYIRPREIYLHILVFLPIVWFKWVVSFGTGEVIIMAAKQNSADNYLLHAGHQLAVFVFKINSTENLPCFQIMRSKGELTIFFAFGGKSQNRYFAHF